MNESVVYIEYEKVRSVLRVCRDCGLDEYDEDVLIDVALEHLENMLQAIGIIPSE